MAKKRRRDEAGDGRPAGLDRVFELLEAAPAGLHDVAPPAAQLPSGLPEALIDFYARCDGARLFLDSVEIAASADVTARDGRQSRTAGAGDPDGFAGGAGVHPREIDRWVFGALEGEDLLVDARGRVWRNDESLDDVICEGTRLDRWFAGIVDAIAILYDADGEFADGCFDEDGELLPEVGERQLRAMLKRDPGAPGPRWRLAHTLLAQDGTALAQDGTALAQDGTALAQDGTALAKDGAALAKDGAALAKNSTALAKNSTALARAELEEVVAGEPSFAWAWLDLAKISERLGELPGALDEARAAAEAAAQQAHPQAGYFHAQLARLAARAGDEATRATAARRAGELAPELKAAQLAGARESLAAGDATSARGLLDLLRAVWPRDLEVLELARLVETREN